MNLNVKIDTAFFHEICIGVLYGSIVLLTFVIIERLVYYTLLNMRGNSLGRLIHRPAGVSGKLGTLLKRGDVISQSLAAYMGAQRLRGVTRAQLEDLSAALMLKVNSRIGARLWILDTIVTAAPLLGLLGTSLGIMDTFNALSAGGISDPAAVSRGIASALLATAIGIGTALYGLLGHNLLHRFADHMTDEFKRLVLASETAFAPSEALAAAPASGEVDLSTVFHRGGVAGTAAGE